MKRIMKLSLILGICTLGILGCQKKDVNDQNEYVWDNKKIPEHVKETISENIHIDADVTVLNGFERGKSDVLTVSTQEIDKDKIYTLFSEGKVIKEKEVKEYTETSVEYYYFVSGETLAIGEEWFNFSSELSEYMWYSCRFQDGQIGNNEEIFKKNETDFSYMTMGDAEETCYKLLQEAGISVHEESSEAYRLEHNMLREQEDVIIMEQMPEESQPKPKPEWTTEDDSYMFEFYPTVDGMGLITNAYTSESERIIGIMPYSVTYNKNGIVELANPQNTMIVDQVIEQDISLLNLEGAIKRVKERYGQVLTKNEVTIYQIQLGYVMERQGEGKADCLIPVWCFRTKETSQIDGEPYDTYSCFLIDAITGEEIY